MAASAPERSGPPKLTSCTARDVARAWRPTPDSGMLAKRSSGRRLPFLGQDLCDDIAVDVCQTEIPPRVAERQLLVIHA